jgi:hypothetical protein
MIQTSVTQANRANVSRRLAFLIALSASGSACFGAEIELRFGSMERLIAAQLFTQDGRHYVRGNKTTRCQFAYLEAPRIDSDHGRLRVRARFSGRTAFSVLRGCVGLGDSFDVTIIATPAASDNAIVLRDVNISTPRDSFYISRVRSAMSQTIARDFKIQIRDQARQLLEQDSTGAGGYKRELAAFDLTEVRVTPDALVLVVEFRLVVK